MTQSEFIKKYCEGKKITEKQLNDLGTFSIVCDCEEEDCKGWAMISRERLKDQVELYIKDNTN